MRTMRSAAAIGLGSGFVSIFGACNSILGIGDPTVDTGPPDGDAAMTDADGDVVQVDQDGQVGPLDGDAEADGPTEADVINDQDGGPIDACDTGDACAAVRPTPCAAGTDAGAPRPSCSCLAATCGPSAKSNCCSSSVVPGGMYNRGNDPMYPATVSDFRLDTYEVTVGRFRKFVAAYSQNMIPAGAGKNPNNASDPGWDTAWNELLPADKTALTSTSYLKCIGTYPATWTDTAGGSETLPINCVDWYEAFAFCIWDGGRLPTEVEWNYAAAGGSEERQYPWSMPPDSGTIDCSYANYYGGSDGGSPFCSTTYTNNVGSESNGDGKWGQSDLAGNVWEWTLDWYNTQAGQYPTPCVDCALTTQGVNTLRMARGGSFVDRASLLQSSWYPPQPPGNRFNSGQPTKHESSQGVRCARAP
jgi:sulfatase modifying factor 1